MMRSDSPPEPLRQARPHRSRIGLPGPTGRRAVGFAALAVLLALALLYMPLSWPEPPPAGPHHAAAIGHDR